MTDLWLLGGDTCGLAKARVYNPCAKCGFWGWHMRVSNEPGCYNQMTGPDMDCLHHKTGPLLCAKLLGVWLPALCCSKFFLKIALLPRCLWLLFAWAHVKPLGVVSYEHKWTVQPEKPHGLLQCMPALAKARVWLPAWPIKIAQGVTHAGFGGGKCGLAKPRVYKMTGVDPLHTS